MRQQSWEKKFKKKKASRGGGHAKHAHTHSWSIMFSINISCSIRSQIHFIYFMQHNQFHASTLDLEEALSSQLPSIRIHHTYSYPTVCN